MSNIYANPDIQYTTQDEIQYLRDLVEEGKVATLVKYAASFPRRTFNGLGMRVDKRAVAKELRRLIGPDAVQREGGKSEQDLARMAVEWLEGGRLRSISRANAEMADQGEE